jgi:AraC-like DNA-binding protein
MHALTRLATSEVWARAAMTPRGDEGPRAISPWHLDRDLHGRVEACDIGPVRLARIRANPLCVENIGGSGAANAPGLYKVLLQISGRSVLEQAGREVVLTAGTWTLYKGGVPFTLLNLQRCEQRMVIVPRCELWAGTLDLDAFSARAFGECDHSSQQLAVLLDSAFEIAMRHGAEAATELAAAAIHLSRLALIENSDVRAPSLRSDIARNRVIKYIERNLRDPGLTVDSIANAINCSKRYVHKVFAAHEETIGQYILNRRLEKCFAELSCARVPGTIAELAYSWGFNSLSHFGKAFSRRYGMTPSQRLLGTFDRLG